VKNYCAHDTNVTTGGITETSRAPNDVRIDCKAAKHSDGDRGAVLAPS